MKFSETHPFEICYYFLTSYHIQFMAPILTSNSLLLLTSSSTPPSSLLFFKNPRLQIFSKKSDEPSSSKDPSVNSSIPFRFDFGKFPDVKSLVPSSSSSGFNFGVQRRKDPGTVFVSGASGQAGIRIAQTLLREGFSVRAGVPDLRAAQQLAQLAATYKVISNEESRRLNAVDSSFQDAESIAKAIGNASKVVVTIGPSENGPVNEVTLSDALQVIEAAQLANVGHVAIVYDESNSGGSTYNVLDGIQSFFNNIFSKSQPLTLPELLEKIVATDVSYTLIKTKLTQDFSQESSYNLVVAAEGSGSTNDYKVSNSQIASLVANVFSNTEVAENKVVEVFTDPSASSKPFDELFGAIPEDGRRKAYAESLAKAEAAAEAAEAYEAAEAKKIGGDVKKKEESVETSVDISVESILDQAKVLATGIDWEKFSSQLRKVAEKPEETPKVAVATVRGQAKARSLPSLKAVVKTSPTPKSKQVSKITKVKQTESKTEKKKLFGGLFQQETIYIDED